MEKSNKMGFGFLRLPRAGEEYDWETVCRMVDRFLELGGRYFDTCYTYLEGKSEEGIRRCLTQRKDRGSYELADKLPGYLCRSPEDHERYFREELDRCGVDYFDVYMLHWLNAENYETAERLDQFGFLQSLKERGLALRTGFSYHDSAALLDRILCRHPEVDVVQLQINYLDWDSAGIESRKCYEVCVRHGKKVIVMEPVKGGTLAVLPEKAEQLLRELRPSLSPAQWALRFVQDLPEVEICLSGMNAPEQVEMNLQPAVPLSCEEREGLRQVCRIINGNTKVPCTGCRYCVSHCPMSIPIPDVFSMLNEMARTPDDDWKILPSYRQLTLQGGAASSCLGCGSCARHCPQHLDVPSFMKEAAAMLENA